MATNEITITIKAEDDASDVLDRLKKKIGGVGDEGQKAGGKLGKKSGGLGGSIASLAGGLPPQAAAVAAFAAGIVKLGTGFVNAAAEVERLKAQMVQVEGGAKEADARMAELVQTSKDIIGLDLNSLVAFNTQLKAVSLNSGEVDTVVQSTVKAMAEMGKTSAQTSGVLTQVQQAFAANALKSEDLKTVFREMPQFLNAAKTAFGDTVTNVESFREAAEAAGMTARQALIETFKELDQVTEGASLDTYAAQTELLSENWQQFSAKVGSAVLPALTGIMNVINKSFDYIEPVVKLIAKFAVEIVKLRLKFEPAVLIVKGAIAAFNFLKDAFLSIKFPTPIVEGFEKLKSVVQPALTPIIEGFQKLKDYFANFKFPSADEFSKWVDSINPAQMVKDIGLFIEGMLLKVKEFLNGLPIIGKAINDASLEAQKAAHAAAVAAETARKDKVAKDKKAAEDAVAAAAAEEKAKADIAEKYRVQARDARTAYLSDFKKLASDDYEGQRAMATKHFGAMQKMWENSTMDAKAQDAAIKTSKQNLQNTLDNINKAETASRVAAMKNQLSEMKSANEAMKHDDKTTREEMKTATTAYYELRRNIANLSIKDENKLKDELVKIKDAEDKEVRAIDSRYDKQDEARHRAELARSKEAREKRAGEMVAMASEIKLQITKMEGDETVSLENRKLANNRYYAFLKGAAAARITDQDALKTKLNEIEGQRINAERELEKGWQTEQDNARKAEEEKEVAAAQAEIDRRNAVRDAEIQALTDVETELIAVLQGKQTLQDAEKNIDIQRAIDVKTGRITELQAETTALKEELKTRGEDMTQEEKDAIQAAINAKEGRITELQGETTALQTEIGLRGEDLSQEEKDAIQNAIDAKTDRVAELKAETLALQEEITTRGEDLSQEEKDAIQNAIDTKTKRVEELEAETTALQTEITARDTEWSNEKKDAIQKAIDTKTDRVAELTAETNALKTELTTRGGELTEEKKAAIQAAIDAKTDRIVELKGETTALKTEITARDTEWSNEKKDAIQKAIDTKTDRVAELTAETNALKTELTTRGGELTEEKKAAIQASIDTKTERVNELKAETTALQTEITARDTEWSNEKKDAIQKAIDTKTDRVAELTAETNALKTELTTRGGELTEEKKAAIQAAIDAKTDRIVELKGETTALKTEITARDTEWSNEKKDAIQKAIDTKTDRVAELTAETNALKTELTTRGGELTEEKKAAIQASIDTKTERVNELKAETTALQTELTTREGDMNTWKTDDIQRAKDVKTDRILELQAETQELKTELGTRGTEMTEAERANIQAAIDTKTKRVGELQEETRALDTELTNRETAESVSVDTRIETANRLFDTKAEKMRLEIEDSDELEAALVQNEEDREAAVQTIRNDERQKNSDRIAAEKQELEDFNRARVRDAENALEDILADEKSSGRERRDAVNALYDAKEKAIRDSVDDEKEQARQLEKLDKERERHLKDTMTAMERAQRDYFQSVKDMAAEAFKFQVDLMVETHKAEREVGRDRQSYQAQFQTDWDTIVGDYEARIEAVRQQAAPVIAAETDKTKRNALITERDNVIQGIIDERTDDLQEITDRLNENEFDFYARMREIRHDAVQKRNKGLWEIGGQVVGAGLGLGVSALTGGAIPPNVAAKIGGDLGKFAGGAIGDWRAEDAEDEFLKQEIQRWQTWEKNRAENERRNIRTTADIDEALVGTSFDPAVIAQKQLDAQEAIQDRLEALRREKIDDLQWEVENNEYGLQTMLEDEETTIEALKAAHRELWDYKRALRLLEAKDLEDRQRILTRAARERIAERDKMLEDFADRHKKDEEDTTETATTPTEPAKETGSKPPDTREQRREQLDDLGWEVERTKHFLDEKVADESASLNEILTLHKAYWDARLALAKARETDEEKRQRAITRHGWDFDKSLARVKADFDKRQAPDVQEAPAPEEPPGESREDRTKRIGDLRWEVEDAKYWLDQAKADETSTRDALLGLFRDYWDARLALARGSIEDETQLGREETRLNRQRTAEETQLLNRFIKTTDTLGEERKKRIADLRWEVEDAKYWLEKAKNDETSTREQLLTVLNTYWDARLAVARETIEDEAELNREQTRLSRQRADAEAQLLNRFVKVTDTLADERKKRIADLRWEVEDSKYWLEKAKADDTSTRDALLTAFQKYWNARLAVAQETIEDETELNREQTRLDRQRETAEAQLLSRFVKVTDAISNERQKRIADLRWEVEDAKYWLDQGRKDEEITRAGLLELSRTYWDARLNLARGTIDNELELGREETRLGRQRTEAETQLLSRFVEVTDAIGEERKKRIADLRWEVEDSKYWLDQAKADETSTRDALLTVFQKYWDARLAVARATIDDETALGREETRLERQRAAAETQLLSRFVIDVTKITEEQRKERIKNLQWEVERTKHFLDEKVADENATLDDILVVHKKHWDTKLALARTQAKDAAEWQRATTRHGWDFDASIARVRADFERKVGKEKADQAKEAANEMGEERKKRIADLRWNVKDTKYWLDKAKADETSTRDELLAVFGKYWNARLALARGTIADETELGREETEIARERADARTELLERFVSDTEEAATTATETIKDTTEEVVTHTRDAVTETTEALTEGLQSHTDMQATAISEQNETWNDFYTKQTSATTSFWSDFNAAAVAASEQLDTSLGTMETHWTDFFTNVKTAGDALGIHFTNSLGAGVTLTGGATTAMQGSFQTLFAGAREDVTAFWQYHNLNLGFASLIVDNVLGNMKTDWTDYYADLKTETTGFWLSHNQSYGFGSLVVDSVLTSMKEMWQGFYDELRSMADSAGTHVSGVLGDMDSQIADTARSLARLQDEQRSATRTRVARRRVSRRELFHSDVNDRIAAAGGAQVASAVANRASVAAVQRQNAEDFTHFFGEGFMRKLQEAGITPDGAQRRGGAEQTTTVVSPIILQLDDGTLKKITERTLILEEEGTIQRGGVR